MGAPLSLPAEAAALAAAVGHPGALVREVSPMLADLFWVRVAVGDTEYAGPVVVEGGRVVNGAGGGAAARWVRRAVATGALRAWHLAVGLEVLWALPEGFDRGGAEMKDPQTGAAGGVEGAPFCLTLLTSAPVPSAPPAPGAPWPPRGAPASGGFSLPIHHRARLVGLEAGPLRWEVERGPDGASAGWTPVFTWPLEG